MSVRVRVPSREVSTCSDGFAPGLVLGLGSGFVLVIGLVFGFGLMFGFGFGLGLGSHRKK